jgi:hypothetical protein
MARGAECGKISAIRVQKLAQGFSACLDKLYSGQALQRFYSALCFAADMRCAFMYHFTYSVFASKVTERGNRDDTSR